MDLDPAFGLSTYNQAMEIIDRTKGGANLYGMTDAAFSRSVSEQYIASANSDMAKLYAEAIGYADVIGWNKPETDGTTKMAQLREALANAQAAGLTGTAAIMR